MNTRGTLMAITLALVASTIGVAYADAAADYTLRNRIYGSAIEAGLEMSNIWIRVDSNRKVAIFGGVLANTNALYKLFKAVAKIAADVSWLTTIEQTITLSQGSNPFPATFVAGYTPPVKATAKRPATHTNTVSNASTNTENVAQPDKPSAQEPAAPTRTFLPGQLVDESTGADIGSPTNAPPDQPGN